MDEEFVVKDSLRKINWIITEETKKIGEYICQKAEFVVKPSEEELKRYKNFNAKSRKCK